MKRKSRRENRLSLRQYNSKAAFSRIDGRRKENTSRGIRVCDRYVYLNFAAIISSKINTSWAQTDHDTLVVGVDFTGRG